MYTSYFQYGGCRIWWDEDHLNASAIRDSANNSRKLRERFSPRTVKEGSSSFRLVLATSLWLVKYFPRLKFITLFKNYQHTHTPGKVRSFHTGVTREREGTTSRSFTTLWREYRRVNDPVEAVLKLLYGVTASHIFWKRVSPLVDHVMGEVLAKITVQMLQFELKAVICGLRFRGWLKHGAVIYAAPTLQDI